MVKNVSSGYAHCLKEVDVYYSKLADEISSSEVAKFSDDWNYCFGGSIGIKNKDKDKITYSVRINTD